MTNKLTINFSSY